MRQELVEPTREGLKAIFEEPQRQNLEDRPLVEVKLSTPEQTVRQTWREASPWPVYADNGVTQMRLLEIRRTDAPVRPAPSGEWPPSEGPEDTRSDEPKCLHVSGGMERASARIVPWSGYWWPIGEGALQIPLGKYDRLTGHRAAEWAWQHNPPGPDVPHWHGYYPGTKTDQEARSASEEQFARTHTDQWGRGSRAEWGKRPVPCRHDASDGR